MVDEDIFPHPGESVLVPWGLEEILGEVVEVYSTGLGDRAVVRITGAPDPGMTVTVPADSLTPVSGPSRGVSPRIENLAFHSRIDGAIKGAIGELGLALVHHDRLDRGIDYAVADGDRQVAVQIKYFTQNSVPSDSVAALTAYASPSLPVIIIANAGLSKAAGERLRHNNRNHQTTWFVRWTNDEEGYVRLKDAFRQALQRR